MDFGRFEMKSYEQLRDDPAYLAWTLEALVAGSVPNRITVDGSVAAESRVALERMLAAKP